MPNVSGLPALDAAIGLAAMFFLLATVCSSINEGISSVLGWRAKTLEDAIRSILGEHERKAGDLTSQIFAHWRIRSLVRNPTSSRRRRNRPSYLPPRAFSRALAEVIAVQPPKGNANQQLTGETLWQRKDEELLAAIDAAVEALPNGQVRALVGRAAKDAEGGLDHFRDRVETAFNDAMERASGWYKRKVQIVIAILAAILAIGLNVDTLRIATHLLNDDTVRATVAQAAAGTKEPKSAADALSKVDQLNLPVGWGLEGPHGKDRGFPQLLGWGAHRLPGWILTIAALSLGAPFWFDLLSRLARLRGAGVSERPRSLSDTAGTRRKEPLSR